MDARAWPAWNADGGARAPAAPSAADPSPRPRGAGRAGASGIVLAVATALLLPPVLTLLFTRVLLPVALAPRGGPAALDAVVAVLLLCAYAAPIVVAAGRLRWGWLLSLAFALLFVGLVRVPGFHCLFVDSSQFLAGLLLVLLWPAGAIGALAGAAWGATSRRQAAAEAAMASPPPIGPPAPRP